MGPARADCRPIAGRWHEAVVGGPPVEPEKGRGRQHFDLVASDLDAEVQRVVALGATEHGARDGAVELIDPDGNEISIRSST